MLCLIIDVFVYMLFLNVSHIFVVSSMEVQPFVIKTEADSNDISECSYDVKPSTGIFYTY